MGYSARSVVDEMRTGGHGLQKRWEVSVLLQNLGPSPSVQNLQIEQSSLMCSKYTL